MFQWLKKIFKKSTTDKEVGGVKLPDGIILGPLYFSKDGKTANALIMQPAITAFDFSVTNTLNRISNKKLPIEEFQVEFNSLVGNLSADTLIYFQNRIKPIVQSGVGHFNDMNDCIKEYRKKDIVIEDMCDLDFLKDLINVRGRKQHSDRRYDSDYTIDGISYDTVEKLRDLVNKTKREVRDFDNKLSAIHKDYDVKITKTPNRTSIEFKAINHAFDLTKGGRVVPPKPKKPADSDEV